MRKQLLVIILITISSFESYAQIIFEKGYFIDETNKRIECLIKNIDWKQNPTEFEYKLSEQDESKMADIKSVKEFGVDSVSKYIRSVVKIDRSSEDLDKLSNNSNPIFKEEQLFLKVLVAGNANLYEYIDADLKRYFYSTDDGTIEQLVHKSYKMSNSRIGENNNYKQQLWNDLKCADFNISRFENLDYEKKELVPFFVEYSKCNNQDYTNFEEKQKKDLFNLTFRPGLNYSSLEIQNSAISDSRETDFGYSIGFRFGMEAEFILPYNKNKWGILIEPTYQHYKLEHSKETSSASVGILVTKVDYKSIELPIGVRHYFYFNEKSKLFTNISYAVDFSLNSSIKFSYNDDTMRSELDIKSGSNLAIGVGYKYGDRYSLEVRYNTKREIISDHASWTSNYNGVNVIFGLSLF
jgi:hypothetical protein